MPRPLTKLEEVARPVWVLDEDGNATGFFDNPLPAKDTWQLVNLVSETLNDSNKHFTVPVGQIYQILYVYVVLASTATAGNRQLEVQLRSTTDVVIGAVVAGATQAASLTRRYFFGPALADLTGFRDTNYLMSPLPPTTFLSAGEDVRIWDNASIDANADDMSIYIKAARRAE